MPPSCVALEIAAAASTACDTAGPEGTRPPGPQRARAFFWRAVILDVCPQFVQVMRYDLDVVKSGMKNSVNLVARSSR